MAQSLQTGVKKGWIAVDLDGTLVRTVDWQGVGYVSSPIPEMAERVRAWLAAGWEVRIFTARVAPLFLPGACKAERLQAEKAQWAIEDWCEDHFGERLPVTAVKDFGMALLYDDRCVSVETDTGRVVEEEPERPAGTSLWGAVVDQARHLFWARFPVNRLKTHRTL